MSLRHLISRKIEQHRKNGDSIRAEKLTAALVYLEAQRVAWPVKGDRQ